MRCAAHRQPLAEARTPVNDGATLVKMEHGCEKRATPFLKWAGGKGRLLAQYAPYFPQNYGTYYEPFCGGGAVFFHLTPGRAVLSDINPELVNVYACVRDAVEDVIALLEEHAARHNEGHYYTVRDQQPHALTPVERAARLIYLNHTCFNGLYRENASGAFNVPLGRYVNPTICDAANLRAARWALQSAETLNAPFDHVLQRAQHGDLVYFDPPYVPLSTTSSFTSYSRHAFGREEQVRLRDTFAALAQRGVQVMLSNSDTPFTRDLYRDFRIITISAARVINSRAERRGKISEILVLGDEHHGIP
jgi:DNA adenine methylase